jgi:FkbM family methyltransferase
MLKIINKFIKLIICGVAFVLRSSPSALKFLFTHALKNETIEFLDKQYYLGYAHIEKAIKLSKEIKLNAGIIIDVGGADGTTPKIFSIAFPNYKIYVFEPLRENYSLIQKELKQFPNLILINKAVGSTSKRGMINKTKRITSSSMYQPIIEPHSELFSDILTVAGTEEVDITTLDESIPQNEPISILKLDVQGYELEVLKGAAAVIERTGIIVLEMNNHNNYQGAPKYYDVDEHLRSKNFILYDTFPSTKDRGQLKEWDSIYIRNDLIK